MNVYLKGNLAFDHDMIKLDIRRSWRVALGKNTSLHVQALDSLPSTWGGRRGVSEYVSLLPPPSAMKKDSLWLLVACHCNDRYSAGYVRWGRKDYKI